MASNVFKKCVSVSGAALGVVFPSRKPARRTSGPKARTGARKGGKS